MKYRVRFFILALVLIFGGIQFEEGFAQDQNRHKKAWPDSLTAVTLEGKIIFSITHQNMYLLDVNDDGIGDYMLAFGPDWYTPESGAVRPNEGDFVTIVGAVNPKPTIPVVIVFEINGLLWREPIENWWQHQEWCDSLEVITVTGTIMVDTTYFYHHYYLDIDNDQTPDYFLCFGPPWYEPESGVARPSDGDIVTIEGAVKSESIPVRLIVLKINNLLWRELYGPAPWSGGWFKRHDQHARRIHCPTDSSSWLEMPPGAMIGGEHQGHYFPDSVYCEFTCVWHDSLPGRPDSVVAGWHLHFSNPDGKRMNRHGDPARFMNRLKLNLKFCIRDSFLTNSNSVIYKLKYWDENENHWVEIEDAIVDPVNQISYLEPESIQSYYAIFATIDKTTNIFITENNYLNDFDLEQNYPNPFNPTTTIRFNINSASYVRLTIFNMLGQEVRTLVNEFKPINAYEVVWDGRDNASRLLPSGSYFYKLQAGAKTKTQRMLLMK